MKKQFYRRVNLYCSTIPYISMPQCQGTTKQNQRCKKNVDNGSFCHYHKSQAPISKLNNSPSKPKPEKHETSCPVKPSTTYKIKLSTNTEYTPAKVQKASSGSIYMYTFTHLLSKHPQLKDWIKIQVGDGCVNGSEALKVFNPKHFLLVKIGLTTQPVSKRINQWLNQCNHQISVIGPDVLSKYAPSSLASLFKNLSLENSTYKTRSLPKGVLEDTSSRVSHSFKEWVVSMNNKNKLRNNQMKTFDILDNGFYCKDKLAFIEKKIHTILRAEFGNVEVECENCSKVLVAESHTDNTNIRNKTIHREWFIIPRNKLIDVFCLVDEICHRYSMGSNK